MFSESGLNSTKNRQISETALISADYLCDFNPEWKIIHQLFVVGRLQQIKEPGHYSIVMIGLFCRKRPTEAKNSQVINFR